MGPCLDTAITVQTSLAIGAKPVSARSLRVPFHQLNRTMRLLHSRGLVVSAVGTAQASENAAVQQAPAQQTAPSNQKESKVETRGNRRRRGKAKSA